MEEAITDEQLIALIEGNTDEELEQKISEDANLQKRYEDLKEIISIMENSGNVEVPSNVRSGFEWALAHEQSKGSSWSWMQVAAAVSLLIIGFGVGKWSGGTNSQQLSALQNEIRTLREATLTGTLQVHSASERIMAVNQIEESVTINQDLLFALIGSLNSDESPNVRYAALQALKKFIDDENVKAELVKSLESQSDPLIQISLITILVEAEERSVIAPLKEIIEAEEISPEVKLQAEIALRILT